MKIFKIKSYCKINLSLHVLKKLKNGYHSIASLITFCDLHDVISVCEINKKYDKINFYGKFKNRINHRSNTVTKMLALIRKKNLLNNRFFKISIKKNIPHGSGLGGGSSNAASLLKFFNKKMQLKLDKNQLIKISNKVGFDVPISLEKTNVFLTGKKDEILKIKKKFNLSLLIVYPNLICSTKKIYSKHINSTSNNYILSYLNNNNEKLISYLKNEKNDLQKTVIKIYPKIQKIINYIKFQDGCYFSRITGSGSACIGIFSSKRKAIFAQKSIKLKYPKYWCVLSKTR